MADINIRDEEGEEVLDDTEWNRDMQITTSSQPVDNAINQMEQLANALIATENFTEGLQENFQQLATSLVELESDRSILHDELEIQTIKASVKRHALRTYPKVFQEELEDAVLAARNSNFTTMQKLQSQMSTASEETEKAVKRQETLQLENKKLLPERDEVTKQHDDIIAALNQRMADKASKQIKLNETHDSLRDASSTTKEYDIGMENLNEDMEVFRGESQAEETELQQGVAKTDDAIIQQKQKNIDEKRTTDQLLDQITDLSGKLDVVLKDVRRTENAKARLEMQSIQLLDTVTRERMINQQTSEDIAMLEATRNKQQMAYSGEIQEIDRKMSVVQFDSVAVDETHKQLSTQKDNMFLKKEEIMQKKAKAQAQVREVGREVQILKQKTTSLLENSAHLNQENNQCQEDLVTLAENHSATMETFSAQILEYRANLDAETVEKMKAQDEREETEKFLDDFRSEQIKFMNEMTKKIEDERKRHKQLVEESAKYTRSAAINKKKKKSLNLELEMAEKGIVMMRQELEMEIERLKTSIELYETENRKNEQYVENKKPVLVQLEVDLEDTGAQYTKFKNEVVVVRNKQKSVQEQINRTQGLLDRLSKPRKKLKEDIKDARIHLLEQLRESAIERKTNEAEIYDRTQKLENVVDENEKFKISCDLKSDIVEDISVDIKSHGYYQEFLVKELKELERRFTVAWDVCIDMEKQSAEQDVQILQGIKELQDETKDRCDVLTGISDNLSGEMETLTGFLDNVNSRRPKDTRQESRRQFKPTPPAIRSSINLRQRKSSTRLTSSSQRNRTMPSSATSSSLHKRSNTGIVQA